MIIRARAPLRLGLAGGGTDVSPYCDEYGGYVLNASIDRYAYTTLIPRSDKQILFYAADLDSRALLPASEPIELSNPLLLHKAVYRHIIEHYNQGIPIPLEMITHCDAPMGSGLGSSSTVVVSMIRAFVELLNLPLDDYDIARLAFNIERNECKLQGGRQDQYSATFGGFNFMEFYADRTIVNPLRIKNWIICELESSLILYFTGVSRESANIISTQSSNVSSKNQTTLEAMHGLKKEALKMKECLLRGDFDGLVESLQLGWENKKKSASSVSNPEIDHAFEAAINAGALAGKVSGAGGGGFIMFFTPSEKRMDVIRALNCFKGQISNCHFVHTGCQAWRLP